MTEKMNSLQPTSIWQKWPSILSLILRFVLGGILLYAAMMKWRTSGPHELAQDMANFRILPATIIPIFSIALLGGETILSLLLFLGFWRKEVAWLTCLLFATFSAAMSSALFRDLKIDCGCFGSQKNPATLKALIIDDLLPLGLALILLLITYKFTSQRLAQKASS